MRLLTAAIATVALSSPAPSWPADTRAIALEIRGYAGVHRSLLTGSEGVLRVTGDGPVIIDAEVDLSEAQDFLVFYYCGVFLGDARAASAPSMIITNPRHMLMIAHISC